MRVTFHNSYYIASGPGKPMDVIKKWLDERLVVVNRSVALVIKLRGEQHVRDEKTGVLTGIVFKGDPPKDWTKPDKRGISYPKKNSEWQKRLSAQVGHAKISDIIAQEFAIPTGANCTDKDGDGRMRSIGNWFQPCGVATLGGDYSKILIWTPNVEYYIAEFESEGLTVPPQIKAYKEPFTALGCTKTSSDEWDILVMKHKASQKNSD